MGAGYNTLQAVFPVGIFFLDLFVSFVICFAMFGVCSDTFDILIHDIQKPVSLNRGYKRWRSLSTLSSVS